MPFLISYETTNSLFLKVYTAETMKRYILPVKIVLEQIIQYLIIGVEGIADLIAVIKFVRKVIG